MDSLKWELWIFSWFIADMERIGKSISNSESNYNDAMNKLHTGSGNLVSRVESIKKLGAKTTRELPRLMLDEKNENIL